MARRKGATEHPLPSTSSTPDLDINAAAPPSLLWNPTAVEIEACSHPGSVNDKEESAEPILDVGEELDTCGYLMVALRKVREQTVENVQYKEENVILHRQLDQERKEKELRAQKVSHAS